MVTSANDFLEKASGVVTNSIYPNSDLIVMRGIETDASGPLSPTTGSFVGDISLHDPYTPVLSPDFSSFDLQSVKVLKGPQGTFFGGGLLLSPFYIFNGAAL